MATGYSGIAGSVKVTGVSADVSGSPTTMETSVRPGPLRISTMTIFGHLGVAPDLKQLFNHGAFIPYGWIGEGILKMQQVGGEIRGLCTEDILHVTAKKKKIFLNQASVVLRLQIEEGVFKEINIKLFREGGFQMTGINSEVMARTALQKLIELNSGRGVWPTGTPTIRRFKICLINSDYSIGRLIRREQLHRVFIEEYGLQSFYEPTIYQGVNTKYFWNACRPPESPPGICGCPVQCLGKGDGMSVGACKCITIAPFRTGNIIINGAQCLEQIQEAYEFMNDLFRAHGDDVLWTLSSDDAATPRPQATAFKSTPDLLQRKSRTTPRHLIRLR